MLSAFRQFAPSNPVRLVSPLSRDIYEVCGTDGTVNIAFPVVGDLRQLASIRSNHSERQIKPRLNMVRTPLAFLAGCFSFVVVINGSDPNRRQFLR